eukprot:jgi/Mesvir1/11710/Mv00095-RA.1
MQLSHARILSRNGVVACVGLRLPSLATPDSYTKSPRPGRHLHALKGPAAIPCSRSIAVTARTSYKENAAQKGKTRFQGEGTGRGEPRRVTRTSNSGPPEKSVRTSSRPSQRPLRSAIPPSYHYIALHKPYGVLSQFTAEDGQPTLAQFGIPFHDVYTVGRLDKDSEGLLLLTNDARLKARIHDTGVPKTYWAQVEGTATSSHAEQLRTGVVIKGGYKTQPCGARVLEVSEVAHIPPRVPPIRYRQSIPTSWLEVVLVEGKNRQVRSMTAAVGLPTLRLIRKRIGKLSLDQLGLGGGEWVETSPTQIL